MDSHAACLSPRSPCPLCGARLQSTGGSSAPARLLHRPLPAHLGLWDLRTDSQQRGSPSRASPSGARPVCRQLGHDPQPPSGAPSPPETRKPLAPRTFAPHRALAPQQPPRPLRVETRWQRMGAGDSWDRSAPSARRRSAVPSQEPQPRRTLWRSQADQRARGGQAGPREGAAGAGAVARRERPVL
ncbi:Hypothetical predicted protein [Marmota monax]|uniref:Uncharacterized protein n=1 Tax=Marmota monax TaxID=9995 RepID=A0A5E4BJP9_MARMO|nr:Hypothetical predicted protein [Marmota monax]